MAHIEVPRARSWRDVLWLLMTVLERRAINLNRKGIELNRWRGMGL